MTDSPFDSEDADEPIDLMEPAPVKPWKLSLTSSWLKSAKPTPCHEPQFSITLSTVSISDTPRDNAGARVRAGESVEVSDIVAMTSAESPTAAMLRTVGIYGAATTMAAAFSTTAPQAAYIGNAAVMKAAGFSRAASQAVGLYDTATMMAAETSTDAL